MTANRDESLDNELPDLKDYAKAKSERERQRLKYDFTIPEKCRVREKDPTSVTLCEITSGEEEQAENIAGEKSTAGKRLAEKIKFSLYAVDGKRVSHVDDEGTIYWDQWGSKVRRLLMMAFNEIHGTTDEDDDAFLKSKVVRT